MLPRFQVPTYILAYITTDGSVTLYLLDIQPATCYLQYNNFTQLLGWAGKPILPNCSWTIHGWFPISRYSLDSLYAQHNTYSLTGITAWNWCINFMYIIFDNEGPFLCSPKNCLSMQCAIYNFLLDVCFSVLVF